jgi:tetratricopeptide (TPR) repeat protein
MDQLAFDRDRHQDDAPDRLGPYVFISYSHVDSHVADQVASGLAALGIDHFLDRKDISWGQNLSDAVHHALRECTHQVIILSPASIKSPWVHFETGHAIGAGKIALPFVTHTALDVPNYLRDLLWIGDLKALNEYFANEARGLQRPPLKAIELNTHAVALLNQGRYNDALRYAKWAMADDPSYEWPYVNAISALRRLGRYQEGLDVAAKGEARIANSTPVISEKAYILRSIGDLSAAFDAYDRTVNMDPEWAEPRYYRAECLERLGRVAEAILDYERTMKLAPASSTYSRYSRQKLNYLRGLSTSDER